MQKIHFIHAGCHTISDLLLFVFELRVVSSVLHCCVTDEVFLTHALSFIFHPTELVFAPFRRTDSVITTFYIDIIHSLDILPRQRCRLPLIRFTRTTHYVASKSVCLQSNNDKWCKCSTDIGIILGQCIFQHCVSKRVTFLHPVAIVGNFCRRDSRQQAHESFENGF